MRTGTLSSAILVRRPGGSQDAVGARVTTWSTVLSTSAAIEELGGRDAFLAAQQQASSSHRVRMHYTHLVAGINSSWRIEEGQAALANAAADTLTTPGPKAWAVGARVTLFNVGGALPAPLVAGTTYYVKTASEGAYTLSETSGGSTIDLLDSGGGTHYLVANVYTVDQPPRIVLGQSIELICTKGLREE